MTVHSPPVLTPPHPLCIAFKHKKQIFSGIQPTSVPHIGNYFGAVKQWVDMQERVNLSAGEEPLIVSIVDLHAITVPREPKVLKYRSVSKSFHATPP